MSGGTVKVAIVENEIEASLLGSILTDRAIPHTLRSYYDSAYDGIYQTQRGWGAVYAPAEFRAEILEIIADIRCQVSSSEEQSTAASPEATAHPSGEGDTSKDSIRTAERIDDRENAKESED